jgi:pyridoxamine 5'-phosphate oxidase
MNTRSNDVPAQCLPDPLPADPLIVAAQWLEQARDDGAQPNPNSMVVATVDERGRPSARVVLCKDISPESGSITFYTNYQSRKGRELLANHRAAVVFHWDHRHRQIRAEGTTVPMTDAENDEYFRTRPWQSRLGAWASRQSEPVESRDALLAQVTAAAKRFGIPYRGPGTPEPDQIAVEVPRPPHWGGYRILVDAVELWVEGEFRVHDRALWTRAAADGAGAPKGAWPWSATRLQP